MNIKKTKLKVFIIVFLSIEIIGYAQSEKNMNNKLFTAPLNKGGNQLIQYKTLEITPVNLFIQDKPWNERSAHIQLELSVREYTKTFHTFLWYYEKGNNPPTNYPQVSGKYLYSLDINEQDKVQLVVDTLNFETPFFINLGQFATIGDLAINFKESIDEMGARSGNEGSSYSDSYAKYDLVLSENKDQKKLSFYSSNFNDKEERVLQWKEYEIKILYDELKLLKLVVYKRGIRK